MQERIHWSIGRVHVDQAAVAELMGTQAARELIVETGKSLAAAANRHAPKKKFSWAGVGRKYFYRVLRVKKGDQGWTCWVGSPNETSWLVEFGSYNHGPYRPLTKAAMDSGLHWEPR